MRRFLEGRWGSAVLSVAKMPHEMKTKGYRMAISFATWPSLVALAG